MTLLMYKKNFFYTLLLLIACLATVSCSTGTLNTYGVAYQSVRTDNYKGKVPDDAKIAIYYNISDDGQIVPVIFNKTDEIMIIDQTMSFFVNSDGTSTSYYDPTVKTTSVTDIASGTSGASVNLGAIGGALGIGGPLGTALSGINLGGSETSGTSTTNTTYKSELPRVSISPRGMFAIPKPFKISKVGNSLYYKESSMLAKEYNFNAESAKDSPCRFSICISYSLDNGENFDKIVTDFFISTQMVEAVTQKGKVNDALRRIYQNKPDALNEPWWMLHFINNIQSNSGVYDTETQGILYDYR